MKYRNRLWEWRRIFQVLVLGAVSSSLYGRDCNDRLYTSIILLRCVVLISSNLLYPLNDS